MAERKLRRAILVEKARNQELGNLLPLLFMGILCLENSTLRECFLFSSTITNVHVRSGKVVLVSFRSGSDN